MFKKLRVFDRNVWKNLRNNTKNLNMQVPQTRFPDHYTKITLEGLTYR